MNIEWRVRVWSTDGIERSEHGLDKNVASLDRFEVSGAGNCLEATWRAKPSAVTVNVREIVQLLVSTDGGQTEQSVFKGIVVVAGSPRAAGLQSYRAVGLQQRFHEMLLTMPVIDGADVATMVDQALSSLTLPEGVTYSSGDVPTTGFQLGDRLPALETVGDFLDAMADKVGRFLVPTGESYTYDGTTYAEDEIVPGVRWGVDANGALFFRRPTAPPVTVGEGDTDVHVRWTRVLGEEVYDNVTFVYATEYEGFDDVWPVMIEKEVTPHPVARNFGGGTYEATRVHTLTAPIDFMRDVGSQSAQFNVTNPENAFDGDDSTYAEFTTGVSSTFLQATGYSQYGAICRVVFEKGASGDPLTIYASWGTSVQTYITFVHHFDETDTSKRTIILPMPIPARAAADNVDEMVLEVNTGEVGGARVYALQIFAPDADVGARIAEAYKIDPVDNASEVDLINQRGDVSQTMSLTPMGGTAEDVDIERIEYKLTRGRGLITTYHVGQSYDADLLAERVVLERLARRATS